MYVIKCGSEYWCGNNLRPYRDVWLDFFEAALKYKRRSNAERVAKSLRDRFICAEDIVVVCCSV